MIVKAIQGSLLASETIMAYLGKPQSLENKIYQIFVLHVRETAKGKFLEDFPNKEAQGCRLATKIIMEYLGNDPIVEADEIRHFARAEKKIYQIFVALIIKGRPLLFLDFDGVLNTHNKEKKEKIDKEFAKMHHRMFGNVPCTNYHAFRIKAHYFEKKPVDNLEQLPKKHRELVIVLSSDWRKGYSLRAIRKALPYDFAARIVDTTKESLCQNKKALLCNEEEACLDPEVREWFHYRGTHVRAWKEKHPTCKNFVMVDDMPQGIAFEERSIYVDPNELLTEANVQDASSVLAEDLPSQRYVLTEEKQKIIQDFLSQYQHIISTKDAERVFSCLAKYEGIDVMNFAALVCQKINSFQKRILALEFVNKTSTRKFLPLLFHADFDLEEVAKILCKLFKRKETSYIKILIEQTCLENGKKNILFSELIGKRKYQVVKYLLLHEEIHPDTKSSALLALIGTDGLNFLVFRENDIQTAIKELMIYKFPENQEVAEIILLLLVDGNIPHRARGIVFELLSQFSGNEDKLAILLRKGVDVCSVEIGVQNLMIDKSNPEIVKQILLEVNLSPKVRGLALINFSCDENNNDFLKLYFEKKPVILEEDAEEILEILSLREEIDEIMLLILEQRNIRPTMKAACLVEVVKRKYDEKLIYALCGGTQATPQERGLILENFTARMNGFPKEKDVIKFLLDGIPEEGQNALIPYPKIEDKYQTATLQQVALRRTIVTEPAQVVVLEGVIKFFLKPYPIYAGKIYATLSKGSNIKEIMIFIGENYQIPAEYRDFAATCLSNKKLGTNNQEEVETLKWYLETYAHQISSVIKGNILKGLAKKGGPIEVINLLLRDRSIPDQDKMIARSSFKF